MSDTCMNLADQAFTLIGIGAAAVLLVGVIGILTGIVVISVNVSRH